MEEGNIGRTSLEKPLPPPPGDKASGVKVHVIKPFKPAPRVSRIMEQGKCYYHATKPASYICATCGKQICSVCAANFGDVFFCPQCAPPEMQAEQSSTPQSTLGNRVWYRVLFSIGVVLLIMGSILAVLYWPMTAVSAAEFENILEEYYENGGHNFRDYKPGDSIVIRDTIVRMRVDFDPTYGVVTQLWFESTGKGDRDFNMPFDADLEQDYHVGDTVVITLHVDEDSRTHDEVIREQFDDLPNVSNIDNTLSVDIVFYGMIIFGIFLVLLFTLFMHKAKRLEATEDFSSIGRGVEEGPTSEQ